MAQSVLDVERRASRCVGISSARGQYTQGPIILSALIRDVIYCDVADVFRVVFFANNETDTRTWLSFQYAKQLPLLKSHCSLAQTYRQLRLHGKWPHAFVGERTRSIGPSEAKQEATRGDNSRYRDAKLGLRPYRFQSYGRAKWSERVAPFRCS